MTTHILPSSVCYVCGAEAILVRELRPVAYGALTIEVEDEYVRCPECKEEFYAPGQAEAVDARASAAARRADRILPYEVRAIRKKLGLTQRGLEAELGLGSKVVTRWERGISEPATPTVLLLRALENGSLTVALLRAARTVAPIEQPLVARLTFADRDVKFENAGELFPKSGNYVEEIAAVESVVQTPTQPIYKANNDLALAA